MADEAREGTRRDDRPVALIDFLHQFDDDDDDEGDRNERRNVEKPPAAAERSGTADRPICVDDDDDDDSSRDEDDRPAPVRSGRKRPEPEERRGREKKSTNEPPVVRVTMEDRRRRMAGTTTKKRARSAMTETVGGNDDHVDERGGKIPYPFAPFRLLATELDESSSSPRRRRSRHCHTLREILGLDGPDASLLGSLRFVVAANYMIDFEFLLDYMPELLSAERSLFFYGIASGRAGEAGPKMWKEACGDRADLVKLVPSDPPRSATNPLRSRVPFGVHHTKLFLMGYDSCIRVVVHTANLIHSDVRLNANGAYVQDFPLKSTVVQKNPLVAGKAMGKANGTGAPAYSDETNNSSDDEDDDGDESYLLSCPFEETLVSYLETYRHARRSRWPAAGSNVAPSSSPQTLTEVVRRYDYNSAYAALIPSVPGRHGGVAARGGAVVGGGGGGCPWGYPRLERAVRDYAASDDDDVDDSGAGRASSDDGDGCGPIVCQFSSMGSLTSKWLNEFARALDVATARGGRRRSSAPSSGRPPPPPRNPYSKRPSSSSSPSAAANAPDSAARNLRLVWPTVEEVRTSIRGYAGGDCLPGTARNVDRPFLRPLYRRWRWSSSASASKSGSGSGSRKDDDDDSDDPTRKGRCTPHIKTYAQLSRTSSGGSDGGSSSAVEWMVLTSHNLSKAAWGEVQNSADGPRLFVRHWELGVFFSPKLLRDAAAVAWQSGEEEGGVGGCRVHGAEKGEGRRCCLLSALPPSLGSRRAVRLEPFGGKEGGRARRRDEEDRKDASSRRRRRRLLSSSTASSRPREDGNTDDDTTDAIVVPLPLPYDVRGLVRYGPRDEPWIVDRRYDGRPDAFGRTSCYEDP